MAATMAYAAPFEVQEHLSGLRAMRDNEKAMLKAKIDQKKRAMFVFSFLAIAWGAIIMGIGVNEALCMISLFLYIVVFAVAMTIKKLVEPLAGALKDGVVVEFSALCVNAGGQNKTVGPVKVSIPQGFEPLFQDGKPVTVGYVPETPYVVSVNGLAIPRPLDAAISGPIDQIVKDKIAVWDDVGQSGVTPVTQAQIFAAAAAASGAKRGGKMSRAAWGPQGPSQDMIRYRSFSSSNAPAPTQDVPIAEPITMDQPIKVGPGQTAIVTKTATGTHIEIRETPKPAAPPSPAPVPVIVPEPVTVPKPVEPKKEPVKDVFCPYHGVRTELRNGKPWCKECNNFLEAPPEYCPYHGCRTEPKDGKAFCPRCESVVEPV